MKHDRSASNTANLRISGIAVETVVTTDQLVLWLADWERLTGVARRYVPSADDLRAELRDDAKQLLIAAVGHDEQLGAMAIFVIGPYSQRLSIGERKLLDLPTQAIRLLGCAPSPGAMDVAQWRAVLDIAAETIVHDVIDLGEVAIGSPLDQASAATSWPRWRLGNLGTPAYHWTIDLPPTFDAYLGALRSTTRKSIRYYLRRLAQASDLHVETISTAQQVDAFLLHGEAISRQTYQWDVGQRLENNAATRARYLAAAEAGGLRCHLLYRDGQPIAFSRGVINGSVYHYETPGFLPEHGKISPGLTLLAYAIRELITAGACKVFDFGTGGDTTGYKERFGLISVPCRNLGLFNVRRSRGMQAWMAGASVIGIKYCANALLKNTKIKSLIKARLRKYGR